MTQDADNLSPEHSGRIKNSMNWSLIRWFVSAASINLPQAASPIAFALLALALTGDASGGAAMILAMTLAQVIGVVPITRLGDRRPATKFLRTLILLRSLALLLMAAGAWHEIPFTALIALAALTGLVNGAAHGYLRVALNPLITADKLPRTLGIAATLNELTFVLAPVAASGLGIISPFLAILAITALGALPAFLLNSSEPEHTARATLGHAKSPMFSPAVLLWLICAAAGSAAVAIIEIGAVALALSYNYSPGFAVLFTAPLCLASVAGGVWVSVRNQVPTKREIALQLLIMTAGSALVALNASIVLTVIGAVLVGMVVAPLGTHYSLTLDNLSAPGRKAELFALLRTANAVGIILASAALTSVSLAAALVSIFFVMGLVTTCVVFYSQTNRIPKQKKEFM